jgi:RNA polymerase sigma-70 factor (ECF subfamily)
VPADPTADRADLLALQAGDDAALNRLITRWEQPLLAFAWRYVRNAADARELAVETFVRLHQQRQRLHPESNLSAWLFTTLANLCRNHQRWWRRHPTVSLDLPGPDGPVAAAWPDPGAPSPGTALEHREALAALDVAIAALPHDLRTALLLHHFEHLSYREIAVITGCSERGVETRLYRARQALRAALPQTAAVLPA